MAIRKSIRKQKINYRSNNKQTNIESIKTEQNNDKQYQLNDELSTENMSFDVEYKVVSGESLSSIAMKYGLTYQELAKYNNIEDPNYILEGQVIKIPIDTVKEENNESNGTNEHTVVSGETLSEIAQKYGVSVEDLLKVNDISDPNYIEVDQIIKIPSKEKASDETEELYKQIGDLLGVSQKVSEVVDSIIPNLVKNIQDIIDKNKSTVEDVKKMVSDKLKEQNININSEKILDIIGLIMKNKTNQEPIFEDYTVQSGQTLSAIAAKYGVSVDDIVKANNIADPNNINIGQVLKIPQNASTPKLISSPTSGKDPEKNIDLSKILKNSNIGNAVVKYAEEIKNAFKVKIDENEFITISDVEVDGNPCYLTHVVIDDPSKIKGEPANGEYATGLEKASSAAKRKNATLMINGSNFLDNGEQDLRNTNHIAIVNGKIVHDGVSEAMEICLDKDGKLFTPSPGTTATELINKGVVYTFASLDSRLIWNGEKDYISQPSSENDTPYNSTVIGMTQPGEYYILTGSTTNYGAREYMYDIGCTYAKSMDQGGSVSLVFEGNLVNTPTDESGERSVADFLYFS